MDNYSHFNTSEVAGTSQANPALSDSQDLLMPGYKLGKTNKCN